MKKKLNCKIINYIRRKNAEAKNSMETLVYKV